jgi:trk system potassium uptake protein TrkA
MPLDQPTEDNQPSRVEDPIYFVIADDHVGSTVARGLQADDRTVYLVTKSDEPSEVPGIQADPTDIKTLHEAGVADTSVVVATLSDRRNSLISQLVYTHFDVSKVVVLVISPNRLTLFAEAGHDPVCATTALSDPLINTV